MNHLRHLFVLLAFLSFAINVKAQENSEPDEGLAFVQSQYPKLYDLFEKDLISKHATYTFAIDVSGTMKQYAGIVQPALKEFVKALPDGDYVRIIRFGTESKDKENGYLGTVSSNLKNDLYTAIDNLYNNVNDDKAFRAHTDVPKMVESIGSSLQNSGDEMNFVFMLTDFRNDQLGSGEHRIDKVSLDNLRDKIEAATYDKEGRIVALQLPVNTNMPGYCLDQLKDNVFNKLNMTYEMQPITSDAALSNWFSDLKKQIMVQRLRSIVEVENRMPDFAVDPAIDIDGNVVTDIQWEPNRLYKVIHIDTCYLAPAGFEPTVSDDDETNLDNPDGYLSDTIDSQYAEGNPMSGRDDNSVNPDQNDGQGEGSFPRFPKNGGSPFHFVNDPDRLSESDQSQLSVDLGRIKNDKNGFHKSDDNLVVNVDLPTPYDNELRKLGVKKPLPVASHPLEGKPIFTFFLPLWLAALLLLLLIVYIIGVIKSMKNNNKAYCTGNVQVKNENDEIVNATETFRVKGNGSVKIPGTIQLRGTNPGWSVELYKVKGNPWIWNMDRSPFIAIKGRDICDASGRKIKKNQKLTNTIIQGKMMNKNTHSIRFFNVKNNK